MNGGVAILRVPVLAVPKSVPYHKPEGYPHRRSASAGSAAAIGQNHVEVRRLEDVIFQELTHDKGDFMPVNRTNDADRTGLESLASSPS